MYDFGGDTQLALFWGTGQTLALKYAIFSENVGQNFSLSCRGEGSYLQLGALSTTVIPAQTPGIRSLLSLLRAGRV